MYQDGLNPAHVKNAQGTLNEYFSDLEDREAMCSQYVFVLQIKIKQVCSLLAHMRFLFTLSLPFCYHHHPPTHAMIIVMLVRRLMSCFPSTLTISIQAAEMFAPPRA